MEMIEDMGLKQWHFKIVGSAVPHLNLVDYLIDDFHLFSEILSIPIMKGMTQLL